MTNVKIQPHGNQGNEIFLCAYNESEEDMYFRISAIRVYGTNGKIIQFTSADDNVHIYHPLNSKKNRYLIISSKQEIEIGMTLECEVIEIKHSDTFPRPRNKGTFKFCLCDGINLNEWRSVEDER